MSESAVEPLGHGRRFPRWVIWATVLPLLLVGLYVWRIARAEAVIAKHRARLPAERAALAAMLKGRPALVEPAEEGDAAQVASAFIDAVYAIPQAEKDKLGPYAIDTPGTPEEQDAILEAHPEPLTTLARIVRVPSTPATPPRDVEALVAPVPRLQEGARWIFAVLDRAVERGEGAKAMEIASQAATYAHDVQRRGTMLEHLIGYASENAAMRAFMRAIPLGGTHPTAARRLRSLLDDLEASRSPLPVALASEGWLWRELVSSPSLDRLLANMGRQDRENVGWRYLWSWPVYRAAALEDWDDAMDARARAIEGADLDARGTIGRIAALPKLENGLTKQDVAVWPMFVTQRSRVRARALVVRTALAVVEATAKRGKPPASLQDLVPEFLSAVPTDPWDGKPLRYAPGKVWSVGRNGVDDGGTPPPDPDEDKTGDVVVTIPPTR